MVISASRKTDIPAFYGDWLSCRLDEGFCVMRNSFTRKPKIISLLREDIDALVFWTKNPKPFLGNLRGIAHRGFPFYMHVTVTGYGPPIEKSVAPWRSVVDCSRRIAEEHGPRRIAWRYDPVLITEVSSAVWHVENFARLADAMVGISDEVATSFVEPYPKVRANLDRLATRWKDPTTEEKRDLIRRLSELAAERSIKLRVCSQPQVADGLPEACCIDLERLSDVGAVLRSPRSAPTRPGCNCVQSVDIGEYDTCPQGCVYCYANRSQETAARNLKAISASQTGLFAPNETDVDGQMQLPLVE